MTENGLAIDLRNVTKDYKRSVRALDGIEMHVRRGEIFGLLGPNGAGKSTLVKIMMTVTHPTKAEGTVLGQPVGSKASLARVGYLPEHHRFPRYLTGRETLEFFGALSNLERRTRQKRSAELLETVGMTSWADQKVSTYSKGMMQRVGVAQALVNDPQLVILDEPTDGVDPAGRKEIREVLLRLKAEGRTVFVNSHLLSELELMCDRVAILVAGRVVQQGTIDELTRDSQCFTIEVEPGASDPGQQIKAVLQAPGPVRWGAAPPPLPLPGQAAAGGSSGVAPAGAGLMADGTWVEISGSLIRAGTTQAGTIQPLIDALRAAGFIIRRIQPVRQSLEDLFMQAVGGSQGGHNAGASIAKGGYRP